MKRIFTAMAVVAMTATSAFAAGQLIPAGGVYYPTDATNQGYITAQFEDSIAAPTATLTINSVAHEATVEPLGFTGKVYRVEVESLLADAAAGSAFSLNVGGLTGNYTYQPTFPLTSVVPASGSELTSKTETIRFNFNAPVSYSGVAIKSGEKSSTLPGGEGQNIDVALLADQWGTPVNGVNHISVTLLDVTVNGVLISNVAGVSGGIGANFTIADATDVATFLGVEQDPYWWLAQDLFGMSVDFNFNAPVEYAGASAVIKFYLGSSVISAATTDITSSEMVMEQNRWTGNYYLAIPIPDKSDILYNEDDEAWDFTKMEVILEGVNAEGLSNPYTVSYDVVFPDEVMLRAKKAQTAGISNSVISENGLVDVYSIDGTLVKSQINADAINSLGRGLYIVNGKKVLVK